MVFINCGGNHKSADESKVSSYYNWNDYYELVCGCNGMTYSNVCYAENAGITDWNKRECD